MKELLRRKINLFAQTNSLKAYLEPIGLVKERNLKWVALIVFGATLESGLMFALYPVIARGLHDTSPKLEWWQQQFRGLGLSENQIIALHLIAFVLVGSISSVSRWCGEAGVLSFKGKLAENSRSVLAEALRQMNWQEFVKIGSGNSIHQLATSCDRVANGAQNLLFAMAYVISSFTLIMSMFIVSPGFAGSVMTLMICGYLAQRKFTKKAEAKAQYSTHASSLVGMGYAFLMQNLKYCRSSGFADRIKSRTTDASDNAAKSNGDAYFTFAYQRVFIDLCAFGVISAILAFVLFYQPITFSKATIFLGILYRLIPKIVGANLSLQSAILDLPFVQMWSKTYSMANGLRDGVHGTESPKFQKEIVLNGVTFKYEQENRIILNDVNLKIAKNSFWAIVGPSGSGKSTLFDLLTGLLHPMVGTIKIDDIDMSTVDLRLWRQQIGLVLQDTPLIKGTILENIAIFDENPNRIWAMECARMANADSFIDRLPQKLETQLGEKLSLSGGEAQRLALARALYAKPSILILDEPTSALDAHSEERFVKCLEMLRGKMTIIMATHRHATIGIATDVLILDQGKVLESGKLVDILGKSDSALHRVFHLDQRAVV